ncbi:hypothetical protein RRG08_027618 [Elysia crispata]|uniref:Uncharacterized protein n=1 Tax=Elysia crispata TaxID=231223 RepID=A0AAE1DXT5_9GAST|nr:hypothetical protein RRG08_027618 [Elysia crispata]
MNNIPSNSLYKFKYRGSHEEMLGDIVWRKETMDEAVMIRTKLALRAFSSANYSQIAHDLPNEASLD